MDVRIFWRNFVYFFQIIAAQSKGVARNRSMQFLVTFKMELRLIVHKKYFRDLTELWLFLCFFSSV